MTGDEAVLLLKRAVDPLTLGAGALGAAVTTALTMKQIQSQKALTEAVHKAQLTRRLLMAALATSTAGGVAAGYSLGKKQPKKTEKTTVMQPIMITQGEIDQAKLSHDKLAIGILDWIQRIKRQPIANPTQWQEKAEDIMRAFLTWDSKIPGGEKEASNRAALRKLVEPIVRKLPAARQAEKRHGSDIVTSTLLSDDASTAGK